MTGFLSPEQVSTKLQGIAARARADGEVSFRSLANLITPDTLSDAYRRVRRDGAAGVDGTTWHSYGEQLQEHLEGLHGRLRSESYRAPPVRRVWIPKADGRKRPIGIPTLEDKVVQRAYVTVLETIYEQDFYDCSYGFRPGRGSHDALDALRTQCMSNRVCWVLDADIEGFFDTLDHQHLRNFIRRRVEDGPMRRMINRWLKAGVLEEGGLSLPESGTPQGGVISPLLANIYLHYVLDEWFHETVLGHLDGRAFLIRYADDFVIGFESRKDADRVMQVLPKRFGKYGLRLHPEKTRLLCFKRPPLDRTRTYEKPDTFDFLGFTHYWGRTRNGVTTIKLKTAKKRLARAMKAVNEWCRTHRHRPVEQQWRTLCRKLRGHYAYYGVSCNIYCVNAYYSVVRRRWRRWLGRRSQKGHLNRRDFKRLLERYPLPTPKLVRSSYTYSATGGAKR